MHKEGITFPMILDTSDTADRLCREVYGSDQVPMSYLINADGIILDAWFGFDEKNSRLKSALSKWNSKIAETLLSE